MEKQLEKVYSSLKKVVRSNYKLEYGKKLKIRFGKEIRAEFTEIIEEDIEQDMKINNLDRETAIERICESIGSGCLTVYQICLNDYVGVSNR